MNLHLLELPINILAFDQGCQVASHLKVNKVTLFPKGRARCCPFDDTLQVSFTLSETVFS